MAHVHVFELRWGWWRCLGCFSKDLESIADQVGEPG